MVRRLAFVFLVLARPALASQDMLVEAELDVPQAYVQAQAVYCVRFLHAVDVREIRIVGPSARLANLHTIGEGRVYEARRGNLRYRVHEQCYAVFPFAAGPLELSGAYVSARIPAPATRGWQATRLAFPARVLTVLPAAHDGEGQPWLPAGAVTLSERWTALEDGAHRRTVRIEAVGVEATQLPQLRMAIPGMEVLPGTPQWDNHFSGDRLVASSEQSFVMVPSRDGVFQVPALQLRWWQADTGAPMLATLPQRTLAAERAAIAADVPAPPPPAASGLGAGSAIMAAAVCVLALLVLLVYRYRTALRQAWQLRRACMAGDARGVRDGLLAWAARNAPEAPLSLSALAEQMHTVTARDAVRTLDRSLYGPAEQSWSPGALAAVVAAVKRDAKPLLFPTCRRRD